MKSKITIISLITLLIIGLGKLYKARASQGIDVQIKPEILEINSFPDQTISYTYQIKGSPQLKYQLQPKVFIPKDNYGHFQVVGDKDFLNWIKYYPQEIKFTDQGETKEIKMQIIVPKDAEPKDYYFVTTIESEVKKQERTGSIFSAVLQSPVLLSIYSNKQGLTTLKGEIEHFSTQKVWFDNNISFDLITSNTGERRFKSSGILGIKNVISRKEATYSLLPLNILAFSQRKISNTLESNEVKISLGNKLFGIYQATALIDYKDNNTLLNLKSTPQYFIYLNPILGISLIFFIFILIILLPKYIKRSKNS